MRSDGAGGSARVASPRLPGRRPDLAGAAAGVRRAGSRAAPVPGDPRRADGVEWRRLVGGTPRQGRSTVRTAPAEASGREDRTVDPLFFGGGGEGRGTIRRAGLKWVSSGPRGGGARPLPGKSLSDRMTRMSRGVTRRGRRPRGAAVRRGPAGIVAGIVAGSGTLAAPASAGTAHRFAHWGGGGGGGGQRLAGALPGAGERESGGEREFRERRRLAGVPPGKR